MGKKKKKQNNRTIFLPWKASVEDAREWGRKLENGTKHVTEIHTEWENDVSNLMTYQLLGGSLRCDLICFQVWDFICLLFRCIFKTPECNHDYYYTMLNVSLALQFITNYTFYWVPTRCSWDSLKWLPGVTWELPAWKRLPYVWDNDGHTNNISVEVQNTQ